MKTYGYARVSTKEQNLTRQLDALKEFVPDERDIITDKVSGATFDRSGYKLLVGSPDTEEQHLLQEGDTLVILSLDRLGRDYTEIQKQWQYITETLKANIKVIDMPLLDTSKDVKGLEGKFISDLVLQLLAFVSEKERKAIRERQEQGIRLMPYNAFKKDGSKKRVSLKTGVPVGRPQKPFPTNWEEHYSLWKEGKITAKKCMELLNLKRTTFYNFVKIYEENGIQITFK